MKRRTFLAFYDKQIKGYISYETKNNARDITSFYCCISLVKLEGESFLYSPKSVFVFKVIFYDYSLKNIYFLKNMISCG